MKFAEMSQGVQVAIPTPDKKLDLGLTPGRRRAHQISVKEVAIKKEIWTEKRKRFACKTL